MACRIGSKRPSRHHECNDALVDGPTLDAAANVWRVPVLLAYPIIGPVGQTGEILVSATSEEIVSYTPLEEMKAAARSLYENNRDAIEAPVP